MYALHTSLIAISQYLIFVEILPNLVSRLFKNQAIKARVRLITEVITTFGLSVYWYLSHEMTFINYTNISLIHIIVVLLVSIGLFLLSEMLIDPLLDRLFVNTSSNYKDQIDRLFSQSTRVIVKLCLLAPIIEEILFRGIVQGTLQTIMNPIGSLVIAASLFSIMHLNLKQALSSFVPSLLIGFIFQQTNSIIMCVTIHMIYNTLSLIFLRPAQLPLHQQKDVGRAL